MSLRLASSLVMGGVESSKLTSQEKEILQKVPLSGITAFSRNIQNTSQEILKFNQLLKSTSCNPQFTIAIDQEGGRVSRLRSLPEFPDLGAAMHLADGKQSDEALKNILNYGKDVGEALDKLGFDVNFAPVVDVLTCSKSDCIGDRAFGVEPDAVVQRAGSFLEGLNKTSVRGCIKHFPGQGDADVDTHLGAATVELSEEEMGVHLEPFQKLSNIAPSVLVSHSIYPCWDSQPAGLSKIIVHDLLRTKLDFGGVVFADDFDMKAIPQDDASWKEAVVECIFAGVDIILVCRNLERSVQAAEAISTKMKSSEAFSKRVEESYQRIQLF